MKSDLDLLMQESGIDAIWVTGPAAHNPAMVYFTGLVHVSEADLIKRRGQPGKLFHLTMERDEAAKTGLELCSYANFPMLELLKASGNDRKKAQILRSQRMLAEAGITAGRVALYGQADLGKGYSRFKELQAALPEIEFVGDLDGDVLASAMFTKDGAEIERIRKMGEVTTRVVGSVADFLSSRPVRNGALIGPDGDPLTIGEVKSRIKLWLAEGGAEDPEGTIFSIGRDAGVPHSAGNPQDVLRLGQTIVFDIYPCEAGGGYFYDFTRTWCLGYAPEETQALYDQVLSVYRQIMSELKVNAPFKDYQRRTCELFEAQGHPTVLTDPQTEKGYVHSVGHGVGLNIHERPGSHAMGSAADILAPGSVITIEPGLYYPERNLGIRLEDTVYVRPDGTFEIPAGYPIDLVLPVGR